MSNLLKTNQATLIDRIGYRCAEWGIAPRTDVETSVHLNSAVLQLRRLHDFEETLTSATVAFTSHATLPYNTIALSTFSSTAVDLWMPADFNNANNDYKFWRMTPKALRDLARGDLDTYEDIDHAIAHEGTNLLIYHNVAETMTLRYYSKYLVGTVTTEAPKEQFNTDGTTADFFLCENEELLILYTLLILANKEPNSNDVYLQIKSQFEDCLKQEQLNHPSQRMSEVEELQFIG